MAVYRQEASTIIELLNKNSIDIGQCHLDSVPKENRAIEKGGTVSWSTGQSIETGQSLICKQCA